ncbi:hypothetical protein GCM10020000_38290 [Streptomyces olivoverticillatus]
MRRDLGWFDLIVTGVGMILGTGIFVFTGQVARQMAGPAVAVSFVLAAIVCGCAALCYAELASSLPVAGSAYTFAYATLGELAAWIIGWAMMLELTLSACVVAVGWSGYLQSMLDTVGVHLPQAISGGKGSVVNLPAALLIVALVGVLILGGTVSKGATRALVAVKLTVVLFVIGVGVFFVKASNYSPFVPPSQPSRAASGMSEPLLQWLGGGSPSAFGISGVVTAAAMVFVSYIGFDVVATSAEETRKPQRDVPIGLLGSLLVVTVLYVAVSVVITGMQSYKSLSVEAPVADAFKAVGHPAVGGMISVGVVVGLVTVCMVSIRGQSRVLLAMSRDRLLPPSFAKIHPRFATPHRSLLVLGGIMAVLAELRRHRRAGRPGEHRHPLRLHPGLGGRRRPPPHPPRTAPPLPHAAGPAAARHLLRRLPVPDAQPPAADLGDVRGLAGRGPGALRGLRAPPQPPRPGRDRARDRLGHRRPGRRPGRRAGGRAGGRTRARDRRQRRGEAVTHAPSESVLAAVVRPGLQPDRHPGPPPSWSSTWSRTTSSTPARRPSSSACSAPESSPPG